MSRGSGLRRYAHALDIHSLRAFCAYGVPKQTWIGARKITHDFVTLKDYKHV